MFLFMCEYLNNLCMDRHKSFPISFINTPYFFSPSPFENFLDLFLHRIMKSYRIMYRYTLYIIKYHHNIMKYQHKIMKYHHITK